MRERITNLIDPVMQIQSDGRTVWVNAGDGSCIGRFGPNGIDIHRTVTDQLETDKQCLHCTNGPTKPMDWNVFVAKMFELYGVRVPDKHMPSRFYRKRKEIIAARIKDAI